MHLPKCPNYNSHKDPKHQHFRCHRNDCPYCGRFKALQLWQGLHREFEKGTWVGLTFTISSRHISKEQSFDFIKPMVRDTINRLKSINSFHLDKYIAMIDIHESGWAHAHVMIKLPDEAESLPVSGLELKSFVDSWVKDRTEVISSSVANVDIQLLSQPTAFGRYMILRKERPWSNHASWPYPSGYNPTIISRDLQRTLKSNEIL